MVKLENSTFRSPARPRFKVAPRNRKNRNRKCQNYYINKSMLCAPACSPVIYSENWYEGLYNIRGIFRLLQFSIQQNEPSCSKLVSLMSSLVVKMLTVLENTISNSQVFLLKKCE